MSPGCIICTKEFIRDLGVCLRPESLAYSRGRLFELLILDPGHLLKMTIRENSIFKYTH